VPAEKAGDATETASLLFNRLVASLPIAREHVSFQSEDTSAFVEAETAKAKEVSEVSVPSRGSRGRPPNQSRRDAIRNAITRVERWRSHLDEVFKELDDQGVPLGDFGQRQIDLGDGQKQRVSKWEDLELADDVQRRRIIDALRKYCIDGFNSSART
jgi:hypothetical protein